MKKKLIKSLALMAIGSLFVAGSAAASTMYSIGELYTDFLNEGDVLSHDLDLTALGFDNTKEKFVSGSIQVFLADESYTTPPGTADGVEYPNLLVGGEFVNLIEIDMGWVPKNGGYSLGQLALDDLNDDGILSVAVDMEIGDLWWFATSFDGEAAPIPEPATMLLFGTGLAGLAGASRRKKKLSA